ncbi:MAG: metallophosphatase family protein, partial [Polyangiaceae bacterium]|nr:metallophosphatase family protein [Polyangiaceae bacterium]
SQREYLSSCPASMEMKLGEGRSLLCVHGSPRHFEEGISPATTNAELEEMLSGVSSDVICAGHTHVQLARRFCRQMVVNVGSVGCAFEEVFSGEPPTLLPWAEFAIISGDDGGVQVELKRCRYEISEQVQAILSSGMPHSVSWAKQWQRLVE